MSLPPAIRARGPAILFTAASLIFLWQAAGLPRWSFMGPGPGIFPMIIGGLCLALSLVLLASRRAWNEGAEDAGEDDQPGRAEWRIFAIYVVALVGMAALADVLGFLLTAVALSLALVSGAGRQPVHKALVFGLAIGLVGDIAFGHFMSVELPASEIDRTLLRMIR